MDKIFEINKTKMAEIQDGSYTYGGIKTYRGQHMVHQNIQGASKHMGGIQTYREVSTNMGAFKHTVGHPNIWGIQMYGVYGHPLV